jgi:hypothetical protein
MRRFLLALSLTIGALLCAVPVEALDGDLSCDGQVGFDDFFLFADAFGTTGASDCSLAGDFDCSGSVGFDDFFRFSDFFGTSGAVDASCGATDSPIFATPSLLAERLTIERGVTWTPRPAAVTDLTRLSLGPAGSTDRLLVDDTAAPAITVAADLGAAAQQTTDVLLRAMFQLLEEDGAYRLVSVKHFSYALDVANDGDSVVLRDVRSYYRDPATAAYLLFTIDTTGDETTLTASARRTWDAGSGAFVDDTSWTARGLAVSDGSLVLADAETAFALYEAPLDQAIPVDFNPGSITRVDNDEYLPSYDGSDRLQQSLDKVLVAYADQVAAAGADDGTAAAASAMLEQIETDLAAEGAGLRYPAAFYEAVRTHMLRRAIHVYDTYDAVLGRATVPYVYYTNETDDEGVHHPFLVIASYGVPEGMTHLWDIPRPPGDGTPGTQYPEQQVTRNALTMAYFVRIPMRDYGRIGGLQDNTLSDNLAGDVGETDLTAYNYASVSATGVALDGVVVYPSLNNTLAFAQSAGEISRFGHHSGRGLGVHYHADSYGADGDLLNLYSGHDYTGSHPPVVTLGFDGVAGYGRYLDSLDAMAGADIALDEFGGHEHGDYGYHYHAESLSMTASVPGGGDVDFTVHTLPPKGAWAGRISDIPDFWDGRGPAYGGGPGVYAGIEAPPAP